MRRLQLFVKSYWQLILILLTGLFLRVYKPLELFMYSHDQDLSGWIVKDILQNHHLRLIGQETSSKGIFIGPLMYYLQIPFYLITKMDPAGLLILSTIIGIASVYSFYFVFKNIFNKNVGLIASLVYAVSPVIVFTDREAVPTIPVMLWSVWYLFCLWKIIKKDQKYFVLVGILFGIVWDLSLSLALLSPLILLAQYYSKSKINFKYVFAGLLSFFVLMSPYFIFETRHNFIQTKALVASFTTSKDYVPGTARGLAKFDRVLQLVKTNTTRIFWSDKIPVPYSYTFYALAALYIFLIFKKVIPPKIAVLLFLWQIFYVSFFSFNSLNVSEYYLNGLNVIWILIYAVFVNLLLNSKKTKIIGLFLVFIFVSINIWSFFTRDVNKSGYRQRKDIVSYIYNDAILHNFPCVAISYITTPGNNFGYRYLFWLKNMKTKLPKSDAPVYTIVYPLSLVNKIDKTYGALGLILPDYTKYNSAQIAVSCGGENSNFTEPMFGYTE